MRNLLNRRTKLLILVALAVGLAALKVSSPREPQDPRYHLFADARDVLGVPRGLDVLSNLAFLVVGGLGLRFLLDRSTSKTAFVHPREKYPYVIFFVGVLGTAFGSGYYHLDPDNARLVWDRIPMTLGFLGFFCAMIAERISLKAGLRLLGPLVAFGVGTVVYWYASELVGKGDLRPYRVVQHAPMLLVPAMLLLFPSKYTRGGGVLAVLALYALAKQFESLDRELLVLLGVSGHTHKHLVAASATAVVLYIIQTRTIRATVSATTRLPQSTTVC